jgi:hypothetical protein
VTHQWVAARFPTTDAGISRQFRFPCESSDWRSGVDSRPDSGADSALQVHYSVQRSGRSQAGSEQLVGKGGQMQ